MTLATVRRRYRTAVAAHDWLDVATTVLGLGFFVLAAASLSGIVASIASWGEPGPELGTGGFLQATRGFGIVLLGVFAILAAGVGWFMAGDALRQAGRRLRRR